MLVCLRRAAPALVAEDDARQVLQVDLVHDPRPRRHDAEVVEGALAPAQEGVALLVAPVLHLDVRLEGDACAELVDLHRVVDDQLGRLERVDLLRIAAHLAHGVAHRGQVDHRGNAREVRHQHARGSEGDLPLRLRLRIPARQRLDVVSSHDPPVLVTQQVLQQNAV